MKTSKPDQAEPLVKVPWLIQRCKAREFKATLKTSEYLAFDYMGSAEFEFGAIPKFLYAIGARLPDLVVCFCTHGGTTLEYLATVGQEQAYAQIIRDLIDDKIRLKERMCLNERATGYQIVPFKRLLDDPLMPFRFDTWLDLDNIVVIARQPQILKNLKKTIPNSIKYMDSRA